MHAPRCGWYVWLIFFVSAFDVGVAALQAGVTNVLTVDAGLSGPMGMPLDTFARGWAKGRKTPIKSSHDIGHWPQTGNATGPDWVKVRHYSLEMLERIIQPLAATPPTVATRLAWSAVRLMRR